MGNYSFGGLSVIFMEKLTFILNFKSDIEYLNLVVKPELFKVIRL